MVHDAMPSRILFLIITKDRLSATERNASVEHRRSVRIIGKIGVYISIMFYSNAYKQKCAIFQVHFSEFFKSFFCPYEFCVNKIAYIL